MGCLSLQRTIAANTIQNFSIGWLNFLNVIWIFFSKNLSKLRKFSIEVEVLTPTTPSGYFITTMSRLFYTKGHQLIDQSDFNLILFINNQKNSFPNKHTPSSRTESNQQLCYFMTYSEVSSTAIIAHKQQQTLTKLNYFNT